MAARTNLNTTQPGAAQDADYTLEEVAGVLADLLGRKISYQPSFSRVGGGAHAGVFLSQLFYWTQGRTAQSRVIDGRAGWVYKSMQEWWDEAGLNRKDWEAARKRLLERGLIEESRKGNRGTLVYRIVLRRLINLLTGRESYERELPEGVLRRMSNFEKRGAECRNSTVYPVENPHPQNVENPHAENVENPQPLIQETTEQETTTGDYAREEELSEEDARALTRHGAVLYYKHFCALAWGARSPKARRLLSSGQKKQAVGAVTYMVTHGYDLSLFPAFKKSWDKSWMSRKGTERPTPGQVVELWVQMTGDEGGEADVDLEEKDGGQHQGVDEGKRAGGLRRARNE